VSEPRPYPFERLPRVRRADVVALRRCARVLPLGALALAADGARAWLGAPLSIAPLPLERCPRGELHECVADPLVAAILEPAAPVRGARIAIEIEPRLAAIVIDRMLGGTGEDAPRDPGVLTDVERGVLAYALAGLLARAAGGELRIGSIVTSPAALAYALGEGDLFCWPGRVRIGSDSGIVRAWIPESVAFRADPRQAPGPHSVALATLPLCIVLEAGRATLRAGDIGALSPGDVVVLDEAPLRSDGRGELRGEVRARVRGGSACWICEVAEGRLVVRSIETGRPTATRRENGTMASQESNENPEALVRVAADVPVEVVVELARFEMPLAEIAALRPGEVLATGRAIGSRVVLRAGDRSIASGELVEIEGEIGVRVLTLG
jgi:type III secretion system YscQ/HrcQ family protein